MEKAAASALQLALDCFTSPHNPLHKPLGLPINHHNGSSHASQKKAHTVVTNFERHIGRDEEQQFRIRGRGSGRNAFSCHHFGF
ncbi:hypothetical protein F2P81_022222 [Scophthalmus maximus]|uniref:Uncharacterized protein n=1 Tax=Scophthalmus maximus TaxID=52904 RepID=A0A6A4S2E6_SCOMX|nr:hypothetical protein F2P81_022222 [Scophthalmus maximus]